MKLFFLLLFLSLTACSHVPAYKVGDCISMTAMAVNDRLEWDSTGHMLGSFKVVDIVKTTEPNRYMADRLHSDRFYVVNLINMSKESFGTQKYIIPIEDLDSFRYADVFWDSSYTHFGCNKYR
jgi:hypothetical protein